MALKKSELYSSLWSSCDELRGGMDASQYKDYVLVLLFIKHVSGKRTVGLVRDILTNSAHHPHGIKVRLETEEVGRVQELLADRSEKPEDQL